MMQTFYNLDEAFQYWPHCPLCDEKTHPSGINLRYELKSTSAEFTFGNTSFALNIHNNQLESYSEGKSITNVYTLGSMPMAGSVRSMRSSWSLHAGGTDMFKMDVGCEKCMCYGYVVQVHVSLGQHKIVNLLLNSETIIIEDGAKSCEIKNIYTTEKTQLVVRHNHLSQHYDPIQRIDFPLIPLDIKEPSKTLARIRKLIVFL